MYDLSHIFQKTLKVDPDNQNEWCCAEHINGQTKAKCFSPRTRGKNRFALTQLITSPATTKATLATTVKPTACPTNKAMAKFDADNVRNNIKRQSIPGDACVWACAKVGLKCKKCNTVDPYCDTTDPAEDKYCCMTPTGNDCQCHSKMPGVLELGTNVADNQVIEEIGKKMYIPKYKSNANKCNHFCKWDSMDWSCKRPTKQDGSDENFKCCMEKGITFPVSAEDACRAMPRNGLIRFKQESPCTQRCNAQLTNKAHDQLRCIGRFSKRV